MFRIALFLIFVFAIALGFAWLADNPGSVTIAWPTLNISAELTLLRAVVVLAVLVAAIMMVWWVISAIWHSPQSFGRWRAGRRRDRGYQALSKGLIAAGSGDANVARKLSSEADKFLKHEPLVALLDAQTAMLEGNREVAHKKFLAMKDTPETKLLGLRGLYVEAEQQGESAAAAQFARDALEDKPGTPWAAKAVLKYLSMSGQWEKAVATLEANRTTGLFEKEEYNRKRAVLLTALAQQEAKAEPDKAKTHALAAHKLDPSLVPAATTAAKACARLGDLRKAAKVLETAWKKQPHPELADTYVHLRPGDSVLDRLKRAETLNQKRYNHEEGQYAIANAAIDAGEWSMARSALTAVLRDNPTDRACLLMADIEEGEHGDRGRVREWLARAVATSKGPAWTADGHVADSWAPISPISGELDAFEWKVPVEQIGGTAIETDYSTLVNEPLPALKSMLESTLEPQVSSAEADDIIETGIDDIQTIEAETEPSTIAGNEALTPDEQENSTPDESETVELIEINTDEDPQSAEDKTATPASSSPFKSKNLDSDEDGVIDRLPDDPGPEKKSKTKKEGVLF